jgi:hypothetical protein
MYGKVNVTQITGVVQRHPFVDLICQRQTSPRRLPPSVKAIDSSTAVYPDRNCR